MTRGVFVIGGMLAAGCGRIAFDQRSDAAGGADVAGDGVLLGPPCDVGAPFTSIRRMDELVVGDGFDPGAPRPTADELTIYFHASDGVTARLYVATRASRNDPFGAPTALGFAGAWPFLSADGLTLYYDANVDVFATTRASTADPFVAGATVANVATAAREEAALLSADGATMYLAVQNDISSLPWPSAQTPQMLVNLSSAMAEHSMAISADQLTIYFDRNVGATLLDVHVATRVSTSANFGVAVPVPELNSPVNDSPSALSADGCRLYFESNRTGEYQGYVAEREPQ